MSPCTLCPRTCGVDRTATRGFCGAPDTLQVSAVCLHRGEEPPINPIVNVFFTHCSLQCIYCQNHQISRSEKTKTKSETYSIDDLADQIVHHLSLIDHHSSPLLGFVTAAHYTPYIPLILNAVHQRGLHPVTVYNSSGYESVDSLRTLEGLIDIYLPDLKYMDPQLAYAYSQAADYPQVATRAIREMRRQVGGGLKVGADGKAYRGLIVRHLVLPGAVDNSLACLEWLSDEFPFGLHLALMAQYFPPREGLPAPLNRTITSEEYAAVVTRAEELGLTDGWIQEFEAQNNYRPDFSRQNPFE